MPDWPKQGSPLLPVLSTMSEFGAGMTPQVTSAVGVPVSTAWGTANRALYVPFALPFPYLVRKLWWLNGATIAGNVDCGVYSRAGTKLIATGSTAQATANAVQSAAPSVGNYWLTPGSYYLALALSSATATVHGYVTCDNSSAFQDTAFALPATFTLGGVGFPGCLFVPLCGIADVGVL